MSVCPILTVSSPEEDNNSNNINSNSYNNNCGSVVQEFLNNSESNHSIMAQLERHFENLCESGDESGDDEFNENLVRKGNLSVIDPSSIPTILRRNSSFESCNLHRNERRVLVIYTGGTIGMTKSSTRGSLVCTPNMLERTVRKFPHLHDESYAKLRFGDGDETPLVLPEMSGESTRVTYTIFEYDPLLDSSNMTMDDWIRIARDVKDNYEAFDGFVILHGTDTMAYTASALSFMMEHLGKSVVITGSQIPLFESRSDGRDNFLGALILAGCYNVPEVTVYFGHRLFRGNRITKVSADSLNAFDSPNMQPLASMGINIQVNYSSIFRPKDIAPFRVHTNLNRNVCLLRLFPSITPETVRVFLQAPTMGVVLQSYGAGNVPSNRPDILLELEKASKRGVLIVNCTQCGQGSVSPIYETGRIVEAAGVIAGYDLTPEAALTKLSYVLGRADWTLEKKREMLQTNIRGELTKAVPRTTPKNVKGQTNNTSGLNVQDPSLYIRSPSPNNNRHGNNNFESYSNGHSEDNGNDIVGKIISSVATQLNLHSPEEMEEIRDVLVPSLSCALVAARYSKNNSGLETLFGNSVNNRNRNFDRNNSSNHRRNLCNNISAFNNDNYRSDNEDEKYNNLNNLKNNYRNRNCSGNCNANCDVNRIRDHRNYNDFSVSSQSSSLMISSSVQLFPILLVIMVTLLIHLLILISRAN